MRVLTPKSPGVDVNTPDEALASLQGLLDWLEAGPDVSGLHALLDYATHLSGEVASLEAHRAAIVAETRDAQATLAALNARVNDLGDIMQRVTEAQRRLDAVNVERERVRRVFFDE